MKEKILQTLLDLRTYALQKGLVMTFFYHEEESTLMRFANSAISLNTNEHLIRLDITAYLDRQRASYELITDLSKVDEMKKGVDIAGEMVRHAQPLNYQPTVPIFPGSFADESGYDAALAALSNEERLDYFNKVAKGLETEDIRLSGIFSSGTNIIAQVNTRSANTQYFKTTDAQVTTVLSSTSLKWEVTAEQSAQKKSELDPVAVHDELVFLVEHYRNDQPHQIPLGKYDIVFGPAATAEMLNFLNWIGYNGGSMKRGFSCLGEDKVGQKVLSPRVTLTDDPSLLGTFPFKRDYTGMLRKPFSFFKEGVFQGFAWFQDDADEFGAKPTGHTVSHKSLILHGGEATVNSLEELVAQPREKDILYIPFLHYMNIVNPSKALITGSSRFGALLLGKDGSVTVPYNVRLTQSLLDIFGDKVEWLSEKTVAYNISQSYGSRNPTAIIVPALLKVNDLEISHSNSSY